MKLSDYVAQFLAEKNISDAFVLTGGCIVHIIDSIASNNKINYLPVQHEQAGAMAADAYSRISGGLSVALTTSGPGATNLLTGVCCSYYDSIPVLLITGQVPTSQLKRDSQSRQIGFQETDVVSIFQSVTKYAKLIDNADDIRYELEKAVYLAQEGRPGPVLLDICDDVQRAEINPEELKSFTPPITKSKPKLSEKIMEETLKLLEKAKRPVLVFGGGVRSAKAIEIARKLVTKHRFPYTLTWGALDFFPQDDELFVGGFGVTSGRPGNFAVQNSDLLITIGTRLDTHEVGSDIKTFGRGAKKIIVDIDPAEQEKYEISGMEVDVLVTSDALNFLELISEKLEDLSLNDFSDWMGHIKKWKTNYPICTDECRDQSLFVNPYFFMESLSGAMEETAIIVTDCGSNLIWTMQGLAVRANQRIISAFNHSPMGYSLPASIGAALAAPEKQIICLTGDGGLQINIQELATIYRHKLNIKIFVLNNHGHGIIQGTQDNWLGERHHAAHPEQGLPDPTFTDIAEAYGIPSRRIKSHLGLALEIEKNLNLNGPLLCNVDLLSGPQIAPKLLYGRPIEDSDPLLPRDEFQGNMLVPPIS